MGEESRTGPKATETQSPEPSTSQSALGRGPPPAGGMLPDDPCAVRAGADRDRLQLQAHGLTRALGTNQLLRLTELPAVDTYAFAPLSGVHAADYQSAGLMERDLRDAVA